MEVKVLTHIVPENYYELSWDERMKNVEELLKTYQGARAVVSYRLHCALPCLALGTPSILLNEDYRNDRFGDYTKYIESCSEEDFVNGKVKYDYRNLPTHSEDWKKLREDLIKRCEDFVKKCESKEERYENDISIKDYKKYVIGKCNWLKDAVLESYKRFVEEKQKIEKVMESKNSNKEILEEKDKEIQEKQYAIEYYKKEFEEAVRKMEKYKNENEAIKQSRIWKLRNKIKGEN